MQKKIAIFCGGPSSEYDVSLNSAATIYKFIDKKKYELYYFYISKGLKYKLLLANPSIDLKKIKADANLLDGLSEISRKKMFALVAGLHGEFVEDGKIQTLFEYFKIPYSGTGPSSSALAMDKHRSMLVAKSSGILCPESTLLEISTNMVLPKPLSYPVIVKPNNLGSSVGVYKVLNQKELKNKSHLIKKAFGFSHVVVQEFIEGLETSCGVLQKKNGTIIKLPPIEIHPKKADLFDYSSKYEKGGSEEITPPVSITKTLSDKISDAAVTIHNLLGCKTYSRSDFLVKDDKFYFLETNTLPGMTNTSLLPQEANAMEISYTKLIDFLITNA